MLMSSIKNSSLNLNGARDVKKRVTFLSLYKLNVLILLLLRKRIVALTMKLIGRKNGMGILL